MLNFILLLLTDLIVFDLSASIIKMLLKLLVIILSHSHLILSVLKSAVQICVLNSILVQLIMQRVDLFDIIVKLNIQALDLCLKLLVPRLHVVSFGVQGVIVVGELTFLGRQVLKIISHHLLITSEHLVLALKLHQ